MIAMFILGFFLDFIEITFVVVPLVAPILFKMGIDPVWLGVMMAINLQTSFLTPPFGFALFYLRGVAPDSIKNNRYLQGSDTIYFYSNIYAPITFYIPNNCNMASKCSYFNQA